MIDRKLNSLWSLGQWMYFFSAVNQKFLLIKLYVIRVKLDQ